MTREYQTRLFTETKAKPFRPDAHDRVTVKLWLASDDKDGAVLFHIEPDEHAKKVWVPRSLMGDRISKQKDPGCPFQKWEFTLPLWKAEELGVDYE